ncbi:MAG TPA: adenylate/guanylate cyclase domain-containing protein [Solirubrobacteraceae bacterium]|jgi:class 3 adenylate cyclase
MKDPVDRAIRAIARRNSFALVWAQFGVAHLVTLAGLGLLRLYQPMSLAHFLTIIGVSQALVALDNVVSIKLTRMLWSPVRTWERAPAAERTPELTIAAWRAIVTLPTEYLRRVRAYPFTLFYLPFIAFTTWLLGLPWYSFFIIAAAGTAVIAYELIARYFVIEVVTRPVLEPLAASLPPEFQIDIGGLPLRWRLLAIAPVINVITGIVVASLSNQGHHVDLADLGFSWLVAVAVSFTISLELVVLVARSLSAAIGDLHAATERVMAGDLGARVPLVTTDETGRLAQSFNTMIEGLDERERLHSAFGAYVDPGLAERVLAEGADLAGEEVEVSVLFLDVRDFTSFAEAARPREVVALLNDLWEVAVPVLLRHGGHANKFIGDGLLGVFGAPEPLPDHGERAVAAALEIAARVRAEFAGRVSVGIGVNSGPVIAGTVGGGGRVEYAVIGDTVNTASRVEAATRLTGDPVLITEATRALLPPTWSVAMAERTDVALRGKQAAVRLWAPTVESAAATETRAESVAD